MVRLKILIFFSVLLIFTGNIFSQVTGEYELKTNYDIFVKLISKNLEKLENKMVIFGKDKIFSVSITGSEEVREFFYRVIKQNLYGYRIISDKDSGSSDYTVDFDNVKFVVKYDKIYGSIFKNKMAAREVSVSFECSIKQKTSADVLFNERTDDNVKDDIYIDRMENAERGEYSFLKGSLPERSFWEKALIPGIVVLASMATIILFFAIRSK